MTLVAADIARPYDNDNDDEDEDNDDNDNDNDDDLLIGDGTPV